MLNVEFLYNSAITLLGIYPREMKEKTPTQNLYTNVHRMLFITDKTGNNRNAHQLMDV